MKVETGFDFLTILSNGGWALVFIYLWFILLFSQYLTLFIVCD
jgi:hypothetical protein